ncbi:MAG: hypothetical protein KGJ85_11265 [Betaproteobacteria bacterium]|nr:hypothetical protein [Betaproteobacteria bacterium]
MPVSKRGASREQLAVLIAMAWGSRNGCIAVLPFDPSVSTVDATQNADPRPTCAECSHIEAMNTIDSEIFFLSN